jgi:hypothetical protein
MENYSFGSGSLEGSRAVSLALLLLLLERFLGSVPTQESKGACLGLLHRQDQLFFGVDGLLAAGELEKEKKSAKFD